MDDRNASVIVCDDIRVEVTGKLIIIGAYTADIVIPTDEFTATQMQFLFTAESLRTDPFRSLRFEVTLPGNDPVGLSLPSIALLPEGTMQERDRLFVRQTISMAAVKLRPGKILAKVIHERGEIVVRAGWIVKMIQPATVAPDPNS